MYKKPTKTSPWGEQFPHPHKPKKCPFCDPDYKPIDPYRESRCVLRNPLWMVIPPGGVHLECEVHPEGHHVFGPQVTFMENNLPDPADKPWCEYDRTTKFNCMRIVA